MRCSVIILVVFGLSSLATKSLALSVLTDDEPQCISRFDYDFKVMKKLVEFDQMYEKLKDVVQKQEDFIKHMDSSYKDGIDKLKEDIKRQLSAVSLDGTGSTYIRWGRTSCPVNGTELVYAGYAGGGYYKHTGTGANYLCLPSDPLWNKYDDTLEDQALVYGSEYQIPSSRSNNIFGKPLFNNDVPCAVCSSIRPRVVMIPGRNACYQGWTLEYSGYLTAGYYSHPAASEFVCLDGDPEIVSGGHSDENGNLFYIVEARCGSLKCPPYVNGRELTCAVCTK